MARPVGLGDDRVLRATEQSRSSLERLVGERVDEPMEFHKALKRIASGHIGDMLLSLKCRFWLEPEAPIGVEPV